MNQFTQTQNAGLVRTLDIRDTQLRDDLRATLLQSGDQHYTELAGRVHDRGDEALADMLSDVNNTLVERHVQELQEIESARERLADGSINHCKACDGEIGYQRLMAYPMAVRCIDCQKQFDKTHWHENTPRL